MNDKAGVAPVILRRHPGLDQGQLELIGHLEGPARGIAGPGTGKTLAVALRGTNILLQGLASPEELVLCTYSRAAARELRQRFIALATDAGYMGDLSRVRIGTIHGLCRRILSSHARRAGLRPTFAVLNEDGQWRLQSRHYGDVFGPDLDVLEREGWRWKEPRLVIRYALKYFGRICDELIDPAELVHSHDPFHAALGRCYLRYRDLLLDEGVADFDHLQRWAAELLENDRIADPISDGIRYLVCDEYQDTSHVEELMLLRLSRTHGNLCVVGDDDQSIYRFRGASVRNLLEFPDRFARLSYRGAGRQLPKPSRHRGFLRPVDGGRPPTGPIPIPAASPSVTPSPSRPTTPARIGSIRRSSPWTVVVMLEPRAGSWRSWCSS